MNSRKSKAWTVSIVLGVLLAGCGFVRKPLVVDSTLNAATIDEIVLLPVLDARPDPTLHVQVARNVGDATLRWLRARGYFTLSAETFAQRPGTPLDLEMATAQQLMPLAPKDARYFMLVQVLGLNVGDDNTGNTYDAKLAGVLVDRAESKILWRDRAKGSSRLSGMLTVFSRGSRQYEAAVNASRALVESLPDRRNGAEKR